MHCTSPLLNCQLFLFSSTLCLVPHPAERPVLSVPSLDASASVTHSPVLLLFLLLHSIYCRCSTTLEPILVHTLLGAWSNSAIYSFKLILYMFIPSYRFVALTVQRICVLGRKWLESFTCLAIAATTDYHQPPVRVCNHLLLVTLHYLWLCQVCPNQNRHSLMMKLQNNVNDIEENNNDSKLLACCILFDFGWV